MAQLPMRTVTGPGQRPLISPLVRVGDERRSLLLQPKALDHILRQDHGCGSGVDHPVDRRPADGTFLAVSAVEDASVHGVLKLDVRANLSHRLGLLIVGPVRAAPATGRQAAA